MLFEKYKNKNSFKNYPLYSAFLRHCLEIWCLSSWIVYLLVLLNPYKLRALSLALAATHFKRLPPLCSLFLSPGKSPNPCLVHICIEENDILWFCAVTLMPLWLASAANLLSDSSHGLQSYTTFCFFVLFLVDIIGISLPLVPSVLILMFYTIKHM